MNAGKVISIVLIVVFAMVIAGMVFYTRQFLPKHNWNLTFNEGKKPYDFDIFHTLIEDKSGKYTFVKENIESEIDTTIKSTYLFIGQQRFNFDSAGMEFLNRYVEMGNDVIIISQSTPFDMSDSSYYELEEYIPNDLFTTDVVYDSTVHAQLSETGRSFYFEHRFGKKLTSTSWYGLDEKFIRHAMGFSDYELKGSINDSVPNFVKYQLGEGHFYIHSTPLFFTNYSLLTENGFEYLNEFSTCIKNEQVYVDLYNRIPHYTNSPNEAPSQSPLTYFLSKRSFQWFWYLGLVTLLFYLVFKSKRRQKVIPIHTKPKNSSIAFAQALGSLFFKKSNHQAIGREMIRNFWIDLNLNHQLVKPNESKEALFVSLATEKLSLSENILKSILLSDKKLATNEDFSQYDLNNLDQLLNHYYRK